MKKNTLKILVILLILSSCNNKVEAIFKISNQTGFEIDSLKIEPMVIQDGKYISLKPEEEIKYSSDMTGIAKIDGNYRISYHQNGETIVKDFGYYTNGYPLEDLTIIEILSDTILIKSEIDNTY
ncbi:hypothetical protein [Winogradskyella flava]|uniref:Uncharacterized protein n=1 Tax=Winogradskyella flava TaxID=1884876 RepID=A0A842IQ37_9FLAO|nr:hypothetical protein [Winogradskyella flava]MBC2844815.1 hypothetical protein [Winogradskyella flava]